MKKTAYFYSISATVLALAITASPVMAKDYTKYSSTVVEFQRKLANGGNAIAQYKLGTMYETGQGVKQDIKEAESWYKQSAAKGHKPAQNRLTYLEIKKSGFDNTKHKPWLASVKSDADALDGDAIVLMALMYKDGIGLKKDLKQSRRLLKKASSMGLSEVDSMIEAIEVEIAQAQTKAKPKPKPKPVAAKKKAAEKQAKQDDIKKRQEAAAKKRKADQERKRLEEQRRKLAEEKRKLELQKRQLAAQQAEAKKREEAAKKAAAEKASQDPACSGPAARFRTTCK